MGQLIFERSIDWAYDAEDGVDFETIVEDGEAAIAELIEAFTARGLPPGAVIEVEFAVRRREPAFA